MSHVAFPRGSDGYASSMAVRSPRLRAAALAVVLAATGAAGCSAPPSSTLTTPMAEVTIGGQRVGTVPVRCRQYGWDWTIESLPKAPGFTTVITTGSAMTAQMAQIRDLDGFSGTFGRGAVGEGKVQWDNDDFVVSGTAVGGTASQSKQLSPRSFTIRARC